MKIIRLTLGAALPLAFSQNGGVNANPEEQQRQQGRNLYQRHEFLVTGLEKVVEAYGAFEGEMYAGLLPTSTDPAKADDSKFMFWLFEPDAPTNPDTLTIWFNGGPGCSSFQGALFENSPVTTPHYPAGFRKTTSQQPMIVNEWGWTHATNMMYMEVPQGTGFSFGPTPRDEYDVSTDVYGFLQNLYDTFPELQEKKLFLFGESYAGYYVPAIAHKIYKKNQELSKKKKNAKTPLQRIIPLTGIGLGNGWVDAETQGPAVIDYAWWHGLIDSTTKDSLHNVWKTCMRGDPLPPPFHDYTIPDECNVMGAVLAAAGAGALPERSFRSPNPYDVTTFDLYPILFDDNSTYFQFYNNPDVKKALNAPPDSSWLGCIPGAGRRRLAALPGQLLLAHDKPETMSPYMAELLDGGIRILVYNGDRDMTTCAQGSEKVLNQMDWSGKEEWRTAERGLWMVNEHVAGYSKELEGLTFVVVYNAGHLVPNNNPVEALDLIRRFVSDQPFLDVPLPSFDFTTTSRETSTSQEIGNKFHDSTPPAFSQFVLVVLVGALGFGIGYWSAIKKARKVEYMPVP